MADPTEVKDPRVPYSRLAQARRTVELAFPDADRVTPLWTPANENEIVCEVWMDGRADVVVPS